MVIVDGTMKSPKAESSITSAEHKVLFYTFKKQTLVLLLLSDKN